MENSGQMKCPICKCTPTDFMNNTMDKFDVDVTTPCLSQTHFGICVFQNVFKVGFNSGFKKYYCTAPFKAQQEEMKNHILTNFTAKTGLRAFEVRDSGRGELILKTTKLSSFGKIRAFKC